MKGIFKKIAAAVTGGAIALSAAAGGAVSTFAADNVEYTKTIEGSGDDYTIKLSVTGKDKVDESTSTVTTNGHADIVLVIDATYSMSSTLNDGKTRFSAIQDAARQFVSGLENDDSSSISVVSYQCYDYNSRTTPVKTEQNWITANDAGKSAVNTAISNIQLISQTYGYDTFYAPALESTYTLLNDSKVSNDGNNKYVIFFSDGQAADNFTTAINNVKSKATVFSMGVEPKYFYETTDKIKSVASDSDKYFEVGNSSDMINAFNSALNIIKSETQVTKTPMSNVTISDTLSQYVEQNGDASVSASDGSSVDATINGTSATINGELKEGVTYTLSIPVKPSQAAKDAANAASTDTSTFKTNDGATLKYSYGDDTQTLNYAEEPEITLSKDTSLETTPAAQDSEYEFKLVKNLTVNSEDGVPAATFKFTAVSESQGAPQITIDDITFTEKDVVSGSVETKEGKIKLPAASEFPKEGEYVYNITETADTYTGEGEMTYDDTSYKLTIKVCKTDEGLTYSSENNGHVVIAKGEDKVEEVTFNNLFNKDVEVTEVTVSKTVEGDHADKSKEFDFTISFTKASNAGNVKPVKKGEDADAAEIEYGEDSSFTLKDGESVTFVVPVGTVYKVNETGSDNYTAKAKLTNGEVQSDKSADAAKDLTVEEKAVKGENKVDYTNTYNDVALTGVFEKHGPLMIIIPVAIGAVVLLAVDRKRKLSRR